MVVGSTGWWIKPVLIGGAALVLATAYAGQAWRISILKREAVTLQAAEQSASQAAAAWKATTEAERVERGKEQRAARVREEGHDELRQRLAAEAAAAFSAASAAERLRGAAHRAAAACRAAVPADPADAASGPPAADPGVVFAHVLDRMERRGRQLAELAGQRGAAGEFCERERDSLTDQP